VGEVKITSRADLNNVIKELLKIRREGKATTEEMKNLGVQLNKTLGQSAKTTEEQIKKSGTMMRRIASQLYSDFKALASLNALEGALKLSNQFQGAVTETIKLSDTIRKLGNSFGIAKKDFGSFEGSLVKGLGKIGASSEGASNALQGLTGLGVKGQSSIENLTTGAITLAGAGNEKGNEKQIAAQLGRTLQASGNNVNDVSAQQKLIGEVTASVKATGMESSKILGAMEQIFSTMDKSLRGKVGPEAMAQMATIAATVGPQATQAMQEYLSKSGVERMGMEQQGVNFFGKDGQLDVKNLVKFIQEGSKRIGFDPRKSMESFGFSAEAAEGLVRIAEQSKTVEENMKALGNATRDNVQAYREGMGLMESFNGAINTVKGALLSKVGGLTQTVTDVISSQVGDTAGSTAIVAGGGILAAMLAGGGLRGIGGALGGLAKEKAYESVTGENVIPVKVINFSDMTALSGAGGAMGGLLEKAKGLGGIAAKGGLIGAAGAAGYVIGTLIDNYGPTVKGKNNEGFEGGLLERLFFKLDQMRGGEASTNFNKNMKVIVESKVPNLQGKSEHTNRGMSQ